MTKDIRQPVYLSVWEKSLVKEYLNDAIEDCINSVSYIQGQIIVKRDKGQMQRVKDYERTIAETNQLRINLQELVKRFE